jgi:hypothetical protein
MIVRDFVWLSKRVLESNRALYTVYTRKSKAEVTIRVKSRVNQM